MKRVPFRNVKRSKDEDLEDGATPTMLRGVLPARAVGWLAACFVTGFGTSASQASEADTQFWLSASAATRAADDLAVSASLERRFRAAGDQMRFSAKADWAVADWLVLGSGALVSDSAGPTEFRPHQHATIVLGQLQLRSQLEERFFDNAPRPQLRIRQRVQWAPPLSENGRLSLSGELLYNARPQSRGETARVDQWRWAAMYQHRLSSVLNAGAGYLLIHAPREGSADRISHVPQVQLSYRF